MKDTKRQLAATFVLVNLLLLSLFALQSCKKKSEPATSMGTEQTVVAAEQQICRVMGNAINKDIFTEYKGKKVYFCCPECKAKFTKEPEKYIDKLPQFKK